MYLTYKKKLYLTYKKNFTYLTHYTKNLFLKFQKYMGQGLCLTFITKF